MIYIYTWNPNDPCFAFKNRGHIYICDVDDVEPRLRVKLPKCTVEISGSWNQCLGLVEANEVKQILLKLFLNHPKSPSSFVNLRFLQSHALRQEDVLKCPGLSVAPMARHYSATLQMLTAHVPRIAKALANAIVRLSGCPVVLSACHVLQGDQCS